MQGRRVGVVRRLGAIDVVVGVARLILSLAFAHEFQGAVGDHLICVHVRGGPGAALEDVNLELIIEFSVDQLLASSLDCIENLEVELSTLVIRSRSGHFDHAQGLNQLGIVRNRHA